MGKVSFSSKTMFDSNNLCNSLRGNELWRGVEIGFLHNHFGNDVGFFDTILFAILLYTKVSRF